MTLSQAMLIRDALYLRAAIRDATSNAAKQSARSRLVTMLEKKMARPDKKACT